MHHEASVCGQGRKGRSCFFFIFSLVFRLTIWQPLSKEKSTIIIETEAYKLHLIFSTYVLLSFFEPAIQYTSYSYCVVHYYFNALNSDTESFPFKSQLTGFMSFDSASIFHSCVHKLLWLFLESESSLFFRWWACTCRAWAVTRCCRDLPWPLKWALPKQTLTRRLPSTPPHLRSLSRCANASVNILPLLPYTTNRPEEHTRTESFLHTTLAST